MPITFNEPDPNNFTNFASLTEAQILAWVTAQLGQEEIDAMQHGINSFLNEQPDPLAPPALTNKSLPWTTEGVA